MKTITIENKNDFFSNNGRQYYKHDGIVYVGQLVWDPGFEEHQLRNSRKSRKYN